VDLSKAVWLNEVPGIVAIALCLIASARAGKRLEALVDDRMAQMSESPVRTAPASNA
jgi:hypothetical protein